MSGMHKMALISPHLLDVILSKIGRKETHSHTENATDKEEHRPSTSVESNVRDEAVREMNKALNTEGNPSVKVKLYNSGHHIRDFLSCVESRKKPITNEIVGGGSATACHLMNQAYYNGELIKWDPEKNAFKGNTGNPKWLTRDYRGEWKV